MALPAATLVLVEWPVLMRILRSDMITTLQEDFIAMAKAKGLKRRRILFVHALKPSSFTLVTVTGLNVARLIGGAPDRRDDLRAARPRPAARRGDLHARLHRPAGRCAVRRGGVRAGEFHRRSALHRA
jgi:hypothetical protein